MSVNDIFDYIFTNTNTKSKEEADELGNYLNYLQNIRIIIF